MHQQEVRAVLEQWRSDLATLIPAAEVHLSGSASVPGLAADDIDLVVLVADVPAAAETLRAEHAPLYKHRWNPDWAAFRVPGPPQVDLVLTRRGSRWDAHHRLAWQLLQQDEQLLSEYRALKQSTNNYEQRKAAFFERVVALLPADAEQTLKRP